MKKAVEQVINPRYGFCCVHDGRCYGFTWIFAIMPPSS
jgi:hypothetical protein